MRAGEVHPVERHRSRTKAVARLIELVRGLAPISHLHVSYSTGAQEAREVREALADLVEPCNLFELQFGAVLGTHLGPGAIGVAVTQDHDGRDD